MIPLKRPKSAEASQCAQEQNKFCQHPDKLFKNSQTGGSLNPRDLKKYANELGLNTDRFNDCLSSGKLSSKIKIEVVLK